MRQIFNSSLILSACALSLGLILTAVPKHALAQISVSIALAPPALPVYEQPVLVEEGGIWAPGYWAYDQEDGYFWVPGAWVQPPEAGLLWTPGYWGWRNGGYAWNEGYWGPTVGFYGGIVYGFGYSGHGYTGGHWQGRQFYYNTAVSHVNVTNIHNTYTQTIINNTSVTRVSFNGGTGGVAARPTAAEQAATRAPHQPATGAQMQYRQAARASPALLGSSNAGKPASAVTSKPAEHKSTGVVTGTAASLPEEASKAAMATPAEKRAPVHAADLPPVVHQATASTGNVERDKVNQQQRDDLLSSQGKQRQALQQKQVADHAQAAKQPSTSAANVQELERQHQAQTQALAQRHTTEQKTLQETQEKKPEAKANAARHS
jgi:WXXGXW repeat (2 copies)